MILGWLWWTPVMSKSKIQKMANFWLGFIWSNNREEEEIIYFNLIQLEIILSFWKLLYFIWRFFYFWKFWLSLMSGFLYLIHRHNFILLYVLKLPLVGGWGVQKKPKHPYVIQSVPPKRGQLRAQFFSFQKTHVSKNKTCFEIFVKKSFIWHLET